MTAGSRCSECGCYDSHHPDCPQADRLTAADESRISAAIELSEEQAAPPVPREPDGLDRLIGSWDAPMTSAEDFERRSFEHVEGLRAIVQRFLTLGGALAAVTASVRELEEWKREAPILAEGLDSHDRSLVNLSGKVTQLAATVAQALQELQELRERVHEVEHAPAVESDIRHEVDPRIRSSWLDTMEADVAKMRVERAADDREIRVRLESALTLATEEHAIYLHLKRLLQLHGERGR